MLLYWDTTLPTPPAPFTGWTLTPDPAKAAALALSSEAPPPSYYEPSLPTLWIGERRPSLGVWAVSIDALTDSHWDALSQRVKQYEGLAKPRPPLGCAQWLTQLMWLNGSTIEPNFQRRGDPSVAAYLSTLGVQGNALLEQGLQNGWLCEQWAESGYCCPHCHRPDLMLRETCSQCASPRLNPEEVIHHFPCSYQGPESDFERRQGVPWCPKCQVPLQARDVDHDRPAVLYRCLDCEKLSSTYDVAGRCRHCDHVTSLKAEEPTRWYRYTLTDEGRKVAQEADGVSLQPTLTQFAPVSI